ncbi:MAG: hypothetical protein ACQESR_28360 [Planctomycetota bacterium]
MNDMSTSVHILSVYLHLAAASQRRRRPHARDRLLLIAGSVAARMGLELVAANCRHRVLEHNPNHLIRRWETIGEALRDEEFLCLLKQLQRRYPQEKAERMLQTLNIELANERAAYYTDLEYAAALMGTTPQQLQEQFGR